MLNQFSRGQRALAEGVGTALLLAAAVGSGIMGERLAGGNTALALLANSIATGCALFALIAAFGGMSGAHFNPVVTLGEFWRGALDWRDVPWYLGSISGRDGRCADRQCNVRAAASRH